jgi:hypothetical protein
VTNLRPQPFSSICADAPQVRRLDIASLIIGSEIFGSFAAPTQEIYGRSTDASDLLKRSEQYTDVESMKECIQANERLTTTNEDAREVLPLPVHDWLVIILSSPRLKITNMANRPQKHRVSNRRCAFYLTLSTANDHSDFIDMVSARDQNFEIIRKNGQYVYILKRICECSSGLRALSP